MVELISGPFVMRWGYGPILVNSLRLALVAVCVNWDAPTVPDDEAWVMTTRVGNVYWRVGDDVLRLIRNA